MKTKLILISIFAASTLYAVDQRKSPLEFVLPASLTIKTGVLWKANEGSTVNLGDATLIMGPDTDGSVPASRKVWYRDKVWRNPLSHVTPATITASQNNYNPGSSAYILRLSTNATLNVTGLTFTDEQASGETHLIVNVGSSDLVLTHESGLSAPANRFHSTTGSSLTLTPDQEALAWWDSVSNRWRVSKRN